MEALSPYLLPGLVGLGVAVVVAVAGGLATNTGAWYQALKKPAWQPPAWVFGPVWSSIFLLAIIAGALAWRAAPDDAARTLLLILFGINAVVNILWSVLFFTLRRPDWALVEVVFLWLSILSLILAFYPYSPLSSLLLLPYITWVSIAAMLNATIVRLNRPFYGV
jgi:translocator protein